MCLCSGTIAKGKYSDTPTEKSGGGSKSKSDDKDSEKEPSKVCTCCRGRGTYGVVSEAGHGVPHVQVSDVGETVVGVGRRTAR